MSVAAVKAGEAYGVLSMRDKTKPVLDAAKQRFTSFVGGLKNVAAGIGVSALVNQVVGQVSALFGRMSEVGGRLDDISQRTGVSIEAISALGYAAKLTGSDLATLEKGFVGLAKFNAALAKDSKEAQTALDQLGINKSAFSAASLEQQIGLIAEGLRKVPNDATRAEIAMKLFGKAGVNLLPMLKDGKQGLDKLFAEAERVGAIVSAESVAKTAALGDAWDRLGMVWDAVAVNAGAALADTLISVIDTVTSVVGGINQFIKTNQALVVGVFVVGSVLASVVATLAAVGTIALAVGAIWTGLATAIAVIASPIGLFIAGAAALVVGLGAIMYYAVKATGVLAYLETIIGGIGAAIMSGNWKLAGEIAMQSLYAAFESGLSKIKQQWIQFKSWLKTATGQTVDPAATKKALDEAAQPALDASMKLASLVAKAKAERESLKTKAPVLFGGSADGSGPTMLPAPRFAQGDFQLSALSYLGQMGVDSATERTAKASERTADATESMDKRLDELEGAAFD
jgi:TP901 family phage tail tape measure protein